MFAEMNRILPPARHGSVEIEHIEFGQELSKVSAISAVIENNPEEYCPPGVVTVLRINGQTYMSDSEMEKTTNERFINAARGRVLIAGLGIGLVLTALLRKVLAGEVESVTVLESNPDVIELVAPVFAAFPKLKIIRADVFEWEPEAGEMFDTIYFDIWPDRSPDNLPAMRALHNRYRRFRAPGAWVDSWYREEIRGHLRERREFNKIKGVLREMLGAIQGSFVCVRVAEDE